MNCPHCNDPKVGEFPGVGVRCKSCRKRFYAGRNGIGYISPPWYPWLLFFVVLLAGGGAVWGITRFALAGDYIQVGKILFTLAIGLLGEACIRRYSPVREI